jgi:putative ABC transport system permease protein
VTRLRIAGFPAETRRAPKQTRRLRLARPLLLRWSHLAWKETMQALIRIALRNVLRNRRRSLITFAAVFISIIATLSLRGLTNGMVEAMQSAVVYGQTGALQVHRAGYLKSTGGSSLDLDVPADALFMENLRAVPGVRAVSARIVFGGMVNANDTTSPALFSALDSVGERRVCPQREKLATEGRAFSEAEREAVVLTPELARTLGIKLGQKAALLTNDKEGSLSAADLRMVGVYGQPGLPLPEKKVGFIPLALAQELLHMQGRATEIAVAIDDLKMLAMVKTAIAASLGPEYEVSTWSDLIPFVKDGVASWRFLSNLFTAIFLFVALLGIVNTMLMSVLERTREIGTMMALGVRRRSIVALFLLEATVQGFLGGLGGALLGSLLVFKVGKTGLHFHMSTSTLHVHPYVDLNFFLVALALATAGAVLAAIWPALRASRLRPVSALASV